MQRQDLGSCWIILLDLFPRDLAGVLIELLWRTLSKPPSLYPISHSFQKSYKLKGKSEVVLNEECRGICVHHQQILVADTSSCAIQVFLPTGELVSSFGKDHLSSPIGICVTRSFGVIVGDASLKLHFFKSDFSHESFVEVDSQPFGIAILKNNNIVVALLHRIATLSPTGKFISSFGEEGSKRDQFSGIAVDNDDNIIVADLGNHRVVIFDSAGVWLKELSNLQVGINDFRYPWFVMVDKEGIIGISGGAGQSCLAFYDRNGVNQGSLGLGELEWPMGVAFTEDGEILVVHEDKQFFIYEPLQ